jgi:hypothetical protein
MTNPICNVAAVAGKRDNQQMHVTEIEDELKKTPGVSHDVLLHVYDARLQRYLSDNNRIWTTGALLIPLSLAGVALLSARAHPTIPQRIVVGAGSVLLILVWNIFADHHRGFQSRSEAWITAIEHHLGLPEIKGTNKAQMPRWSTLWPLETVQRTRWLLFWAILGYWIAAVFSFG